MKQNFRNLRISPEELHLTGRCPLLMEREIPLFVSVFTIVTVVLNGVRYVLAVKNAAECRKDGSSKRAGWGLPGGGVREGETFSEAAVREVAYESGIRISNLTWRLYEHNVLTPRPGDKPDYTRCHLVLGNLSDGDFYLEEGMKQTLIHVFVAEPDWSGPVAEMLNLRLALIPNENPTLELSPEMGAKLGIREASELPDKSQEITAIGLFPFEELRESTSFPPEFYPIHLIRFRRVFPKKDH